MLKTRQKKKEEHIDETWLIPYADMLTLLLALFIVLFAVSTVDPAIFENMANSFKSALNGGTGPLDYTSPVSIVEQTSIPTSENALIPKKQTVLLISCRKLKRKLMDISMITT